MTGVPVLVCGNELRGDDAVGLAIASSLPEPARSRAAVSAIGQLDADRLVEPGVEPCVVVDAVLGIPSGSVLVLPLASLATSPERGAATSSHGLSIGKAVALAGAVAGRPVDGVFVGVGVERFDADATLSPAVAAGIPAARLAVASAVERIARLRDAAESRAAPEGE